MKRVLIAALALSSVLAPMPVHAAPKNVVPAFVDRQAPTVRLTVGNQGYDVLVVQYRLTSWGYHTGVDGKFGPRTQRAVIHWQRINGLTADGVVGKATLRSMGLSAKDLVASPQSIAPSTRPKARSPKPKAPRVPTFAGPSGADQWHDLALSVGWTQAQWPMLRCIINRESHGIPTAGQTHNAKGLLQILQTGWPGVDLYVPSTNLRAGLSMFRVRGWQPWGGSCG